jgi:hypothetical protein
MNLPRFYAHEYAREHWEIRDHLDGDRPIYDDQDRIAVWRDSDAVARRVNELNEKTTNDDENLPTDRGGATRSGRESLRGLQERRAC